MSGGLQQLNIAVSPTQLAKTDAPAVSPTAAPKPPHHRRNSSMTELLGGLMGKVKAKLRNTDDVLLSDPKYKDKSVAQIVNEAQSQAYNPSYLLGTQEAKVEERKKRLGRLVAYASTVSLTSGQPLLKAMDDD